MLIYAYHATMFMLAIVVYAGKILCKKSSILFHDD